VGAGWTEHAVHLLGQLMTCHSAADLERLGCEPLLSRPNGPCTVPVPVAVSSVQPGQSMIFPKTKQ